VRFLTSVLLVCACSFPLFGWTETTERRIAQKAVQLAPADVRLLIEQFSAEFEQGRSEAAAADAGNAHQGFGERHRTALRQQIEREVTAAVTTMRKRGSTRQFVRSLGVIAHLVGDANNPFHVADSDARLRPMKGDFEGYLEKRSAVIPTIFYGLEEPFRLSGFLDTTMNRTAGYYPLLVDEYFVGGRVRSSAEFDDRSTAFGVIALSYSHAVTDLVNVYYHVWNEAGGDVRSAKAMKKGTVLLNPRPAPVLGTSGPSKLQGQ
jgi:hypothetical protein